MMVGCILLADISDRIVDRELSDAGEGKRERIVGRRLKEGYAHYKRYLEILNALSKHGFGYAFERLKSVELMPKLDGAREDVKSYPEAARLRMVFEELGPTFVKIGQILSTRPDLVPKAYITEFEKLRDDVAAMEFTEVRAIIEKELSGKLTDIFKSFVKEPVGAASIGQVHKAVTQAGSKVAVKVRRPKVKEMITVDMEILEDLAELFGEMAAVSSVMDPVDIVKELRRLLLREIDYTIEARSIEHFYTDFKDVDHVKIPAVHWDLTTKRVLTMDFIKGIAVDEIDELKKAGIDPKVVANNVGTAVARMIFVKGYFHGDPHGGNILVLPGGKIALLDFGSVGYVDARLRDKIRLFYFSISREDTSRATELFLDICGVAEGRINRPALEQDFREFLDYQRLIRQGKKISEGMNQKLVAVALKHEFAPPTPFILLERSLLLAEGVTRELSPNFDFNQMIAPVLKDVVKEKLESAMDPVGMIQSAQEYRELRRKGPKKLYSILEKLDSGEIVIRAEVEALNELRADIWRIMGIMGVSIVAMILIFFITIFNITLETPLLNMSIGALPIIFVWLVSIWWIMRRWKGPR